MVNDRSMTCERLVDVLDDYFDLSGGTALHAAVDAHLGQCPTCAALVADVRALRAAARTLEPIEPPDRVWHQVRARIGADATARRFWHPLAAAAGFVLVASSLAWIGGRLTETPPAARVDHAAPLVEFQLAEAEYTDAIERLQEAAAAAGPRLDAVTTETLRAGIDDIDMAIGDAREALAREPGDPLSQESLLDALSSKVSLLQDTVALLGDLEPATEEQTP